MGMVEVHWQYWCSNYEIVRQYPRGLYDWMMYMEEYVYKTITWGCNLKNESYYKRQLKIKI